MKNLLILSVLFIFVSCSSDDSNANQPDNDTAVFLATITAASPIDITPNSATITANITNDGGGEITARGAVWSTSTSPDTDDYVLNEGAGGGTLVVTISTLEPETQYFVRIYATNGAGTSFSNEISFTTEL